MFNELNSLFDDDVYDLDQPHSRWVIRGEVGVGYQIWDMELDQPLAQLFTELGHAYQFMKILDQYESTGQYKVITE